jgi:hypothetical protein
MLKPDGRMEMFRATTLPIWARRHEVASIDLAIGAEMAPWIVAMSAHNRIGIDDFVSDALYGGSFMLSAVRLGLRVGRTHGRDWTGDLTPILSGPVTDAFVQAPIRVTVPVGVLESLQLSRYSPTAAAHYGVTIMRAAMDRPVPGAELVVAAVGNPQPGQPMTIHQGESIPVPYMNPYPYQPL